MSEFPLRLNVNGRDYVVHVRPHWTLLRVLREELNLTGTKYGCGTGECGACSVLVDGMLVHSCLMLALQADGKKILTIEGLGEGPELHPVQAAFVKHGAVQCGYCTPGMVLAAKAFLDENKEPIEREIRAAIDSNLCRCTGYAKIVDAIFDASRMMKRSRN